MIACQFKTEIPLVKNKWCSYRSFKQFDVDSFDFDLSTKLNTGGLDTDHVNKNTVFSAKHF